jgi:cell division transport system permease protein
MTKAAHIIKELGRNLVRHPGTTLGALLSLTLLFLLFEIYWVTAATTDRFYNHLLSELTMEVFLDEAVADSTLPSLQERIGAMDGIVSIAFVSKEQARAELSRLLGVDLLVGYEDTNPLPRSFLLTFSPEYLNTAALSTIEQKIAALPGVLQVSYGKQWLEKVESARALILKVGVVLGGVILLAAALSTINSIRLLTRLRAVGLRQMRLLGAGRLFLALPFLLEGLLIGALSAGAGWLLIFYGKQKIAFTQFEIVMPMLQDIAVFCAAAALLGTISGYLGIRSSLR